MSDNIVNRRRKYESDSTTRSENYNDEYNENRQATGTKFGNKSKTGSKGIKVILFFTVLCCSMYMYMYANTSYQQFPMAGENKVKNDELLSADRAQTKTMKLDDTSFLKGIQDINTLRKEFYDRYGGEKEAKEMLSRGIISVGTTKEQKDRAILHTAERILRAMHNNNNDNKAQSQTHSKNNLFIMSFGGYSVTVARGNHLSQSYPFIMKKLLSSIFSNYFHLDLVVRNHAIGGIPSFPYGWCLKNYLGDDSDVISWDYAMNEGRSDHAFESYLRHGLTLSKRPMMIVLETKKSRVDILNHYHYTQNLLLDSIAVGRADVAIADKKVLSLPDYSRPKGFQMWDEWGAPRGTPGQNSWHPKFKEHELMGWMISMYFLDALEKALNMFYFSQSSDEINTSNNNDGNSDINSKGESHLLDWENMKNNEPLHHKILLLPKPKTGTFQNGKVEETVPQFLYGSQSSSSTTVTDTDVSENNDLYDMGHISCRSSFLPNIHGPLTSTVVSGLYDTKQNYLLGPEDKFYNDSWLVDMGDLERTTKFKVQEKGGLGYIDMKLAFYGIAASGPLTLWIPHEEDHNDNDNNDNNNNSHHNHKNENGDCPQEANHWFKDSLIFCEVNEKRGNDECKMESDLQFSIGGITVPSKDVVKITTAAEYLSKQICVNVKIPSDSKISKRKDASDEDGDAIGLDIRIVVKNDAVKIANGACSISHIIWQSI